MQEKWLFATTQPLDTHHSNDRNKHTQVPCTTGGLEKKKEMIKTSTKAFLKYLL